MAEVASKRLVSDAVKDYHVTQHYLHKHEAYVHNASEQ